VTLDPRAVETAAGEAATLDAAGTPREATVANAAVPSVSGRIGRFEVRAVLGQGGFGRVYRAYDPRLQREVALKVPNFGADEPELVERFLEEARAAGRLRHPNIVAVFESGQAGNDYYIASELVEGQALVQRLRDDPPDFRQAARWVRELATALAYAHAAKVIHRDIKPANILLDRTGRPQLTDFGLAKRAGEDATRTVDGTVLGTPAYMAPEQARGELAAVGPHSDQYSLGVVLYELLARRRPFDGSPHAILAQVTAGDFAPPRRFNPAIPRDLEAICLKAMAFQPSSRYASAAELGADLEHFLAGEPVHARHPSGLEQARRWLRRHRQAALLTSGVAAAVLITLAAVRWNGGFQQPPAMPDSPPETESSADRQQQLTAQQLRMTNRNHLSSIGLALQATQSALGHLPQPAIYGKDGTPLLSWRVAILPYLDQKTLYQRFKLDEAWDSPHNKELLQHMPRVFESQGGNGSAAVFHLLPGLRRRGGGV
jgi:serine/threonine protein kinase